jgi:hypothetical protein
VARRNDDNRCYVYVWSEFKCDSWTPVIHPNHQKILTRGGGHVVPRSHNRCRDAPLWYTRY